MAGAAREMSQKLFCAWVFRQGFLSRSWLKDRSASRQGSSSNVRDKWGSGLVRICQLGHGLRMSNRSQLDLFGTVAQADLFGLEAETPTYRPDLEKVRSRLHKMLAEARTADTMPKGRISLYRTVFPQMTLWLPEEEAAQLRFEFETELERLKAA